MSKNVLDNENRGLFDNENQKKRFHIKKGGCACTENHLKIGIQLTVLLVVVLTIVTVGISLFRSSDADSIHRFCIEGKSENVDPGPGEVGKKLTGLFTLNAKTFTIDYKFYYPLTLSNIQSLLVRGPVPIGQNIGPIAFSMCGAPNLVDVCNVFTTPGLIEGTIRQVEPGGTAALPQMKAIREDPSRYYIEILTASFPTSPGALRAPLNNICGTSL